MDLIVNQMMKLEVVHDTDGYGVVECLAGASVIKDGLAVDDLELRLSGLGIGDLAGLLTVNILTREDVAPHSRHLHALKNVLFVCAVKHGGHDLPSQLTGSNSEVDLKHLTDVHT